ncbi:MAG TPA: 4'-phosphopantetheinyl transferase superfamily protein [Rhodocyclaceae bacterium]|nr:4'-phosphopantetheinyl transferase superfamily protein [Rhodocyclaceae bacterium]
MTVLAHHQGQDSLRRPASTPPCGAGWDALRSFALAAAAASDRDKEVIPVVLDLPGETVCQLAALLSDAELRRAGRFRQLRDRHRYIVAHARLRQLLAERLALRPHAVAIGCNAQGKPELRGRQAASGWHFNLSYSDGAGGGLALCVLSRRGPIGVDVEAVRRLDDADSLARQFFSGREYAIYRLLSPEDRPLGFFNCWTRKEAVVKALGTGLSHDLGAFDVSLAPGQPAYILGLGGAPGELCGWRLESIGPIGGRVAALVTPRMAR